MKPTFTFVVKRREDDANGNPIWLSVGRIMLWDRGGRISGKLRLNHLPGEFHVFQDLDDPAPSPKRGRPVYKGEEPPAPTDQDMFDGPFLDGPESENTEHPGHPSRHGAK